MANFNIDYKKLVYGLNHPATNTSNFFNYLKSLTEPFNNLKNLFDAFRKESLNEIKTTGQIVHLERVLNDTFDKSGRQIIVKDIEKQKAVYLFDRDDIDQINEEEKSYLHHRDKIEEMDEEDRLILYDRQNYGNGGFEVNVPFKLKKEELIKMKLIVNYYKLPGKKYIIKTIE